MPIGKGGVYRGHALGRRGGSKQVRCREINNQRRVEVEDGDDEDGDED